MVTSLFHLCRGVISGGRPSQAAASRRESDPATVRKINIDANNLDSSHDSQDSSHYSQDSLDSQDSRQASQDPQASVTKSVPPTNSKAEVKHKEEEVTEGEKGSENEVEG